MIGSIYEMNTHDRCEIFAQYMLEHHETVRGTAKHFGISKSTVHKDVTVQLEKINPSLHEEIKALLDKNKSERHLRGGEATRIKYLTLQHINRHE